MKKTKRIMSILFLAALLISMLCVPALALTESEVEAQVAASGKEAVTGNVLIWFLCAVAFLKVSQKIDSFMATLGVNVGRTGGSLLSEAMIAMRAVTMVVGGRHGGGAGRAGSAAGSTAGKSDSSGMAGFFKGGLIGMAGRHITNSAVKTATTQTSAVHTAKNQVQQAAASSASAAQTVADAHINNEVHTGGSTIYTENGAPVGAPPQEGVILDGSEIPPSTPTADPIPQAADIPPDLSPPQDGVIITGSENTVHAPQTENIFGGGSESSAHVENTVAGGSGTHTQSHTERVHTNQFQSGTGALPTLGGMVFSHSLASGGSFANDVIGTVARGEVAGSITGDMAAQSLQSYLGYTAESKVPPIFSNAEIGGGRITGCVSTPEQPQPLVFGMYHAGQYTEPTGTFSKVRSADGSLWYTQLAQDTVERKPYKAPDGSVAYEERIVKKLPTPPKRKDRI